MDCSVRTLISTINVFMGKATTGGTDVSQDHVSAPNNYVKRTLVRVVTRFFSSAVSDEDTSKATPIRSSETIVNRLFAVLIFDNVHG